MMRPMSETNEPFDAIICGGGLVGLTTALALNSAGLRVCVVDALPFETQTAKAFDGRSCAIAFANMRMLRALGVAERLGDNKGPINEILVSDGRPHDGLRKGGPGMFSLHFDAAEFSGKDEGEPLGWMVENRHMRMALLDEARARKSITLIAPVRAERFHFEGSTASVDLSDGQTLHAPLIVGAEGRNSPARKAAGIRQHGWGYGQWGVVATVAHEQPHNGIAHEYFMPNGPFAILPLPGNRASLVWTETPAAARYLKTAPDDFFQAELERRFGSFLGPLTPEGPRWAYPLTLMVVERYIAPRLALVGDAAHGMHPIAGQGFNAGIRDAAALADVLAQNIRTGLDVADPIALERYEQWRRFDNTALLAATEGFVRLFSNDSAPLRLLRGMGMAAVDKIGPARRFFAREAGGGVGTLPNLLQGELP
jgi:2-octaprenyl-6-methoxyphenol hydroxylase